MCMNDWRIGRLITYNVVNQQVNAGNSPTLPANPNRIAIIITPRTVLAGTNGFVVNFGGGVGVVISYASGWLNWSLASHGKLIQESLVCTMLVGNIDISITELIMPSNYLSAATKQFESEMARSGIPGYGGQ